ncbi:MAG: hypothetical protein HQL49_09255 [Gammaproteobacteria bacterium]|nr:hypothetical protein [Gammaproteobacteria bacterium]
MMQFTSTGTTVTAKLRIITPFLLAPTLLLSGCGEEAATVASVQYAYPEYCSQGEIIRTVQSLDLAISGDGFFQVLLVDGSTGYTRDGFFIVNNKGEVTTRSGYLLQPYVRFEERPLAIVVHGNGDVYYQGTSTTTMNKVGTLTLGVISKTDNFDIIAENIFKPSATNAGVSTAPPMRYGMGTIVQGALEVPPRCSTFRSENSTILDCKQNNFATTKNALNIAIDGRGFFQVRLPEGTLGYSRDGNLHRDSRGYLVTRDGYELYPAILIPATAINYTIESDGRVTYILPYDAANLYPPDITIPCDAAPASEAKTAAIIAATEAGDIDACVVTQSVDPTIHLAGTIELVDFVNPAELAPRTDGVTTTTPEGVEVPLIDYLKPTVKSGTAILATPGAGGMGLLKSGVLETPPACITYRSANPQNATPSYNHAPSVSAGNDISVMAAQPVALTAVAEDQDGMVTSYLWRQISGDVMVTLEGVDSATASFVSPPVSGATPIVFEVNAVDDLGVTATDTVTVTLYPGENSLPVAVAGEDVAAISGDVVILDGSASSDTDGTIVSYSWTQILGVDAKASDKVEILDATKAVAAITAPVAPAGTTLILIFELTITDDRGGVATDRVIVTAADVANALPLVDAGVDQKVTAGAAVVLKGLAADTDGTIATTTWKQIAGTAVTLSDATKAEVKFTAPIVKAEETLIFEFSVKDDRGGIKTDTVAVTVTPK